ncbi:MAG: CD225/dispanin family protein [Myxococcota bacterium]|nr:CD225/dispanin family protein [Myxococcota bacterium]
MASCPMCLNEVAAETTYCPHCGATLGAEAAASAAEEPAAAAPPHAPPPPAAGGPADSGEAAGTASMAGGDPPNHATALGLAIFTTLCCCIPGGIGALIFAFQAKTAIGNSDYEKAESKIKTSYIFSGISIVLGLVIIMLNVLVVILEEM